MVSSCDGIEGKASSKAESMLFVAAAAAVRRVVVVQLVLLYICCTVIVMAVQVLSYGLLGWLPAVLVCVLVYHSSIA